MNPIANRILIALGDKGYQQNELAEHLGITRAVISTWKSGESKSYEKHLPQIAEFLGVSVDWLRGGLDDNDLELLRKYNLLNEQGQRRAREYMEELVRLYS